MKNNTLLRLYEEREYHNLTQKEIGNILSVKQQTYSAWEVGTKIIPFKHLFNLAKFYNVSLDYLIGTNNNKNSKVTISQLNPIIIGKNIKVFRESVGINQKELAKILNTTPSTICAYEKGKTIILTAFALELSQKYQLSLDWLVGSSNKMYY